MKGLLICFLLLTQCSYSQVNLNLGLRAYYPFSGNANDVSGNNNNPVFNNATLTADRFGNPNSAYHFNGIDNYMRILNSSTINTNNKLSMVAWVKPLGFYQGQCHGNSIMMKGISDFQTGNYLLRYDDNAFNSGMNCSIPTVDPNHQNFYGNGSQPPSPGYLPYIQTGQWTSVIATFDGDSTRLYINCELKVTASQAGATFTNSHNLHLGNLNNAQYPYWLNGDLDEIRIYDRALTVDEVNVLGGCNITTGCEGWLSTPSAPSYVNIGDVSVAGNQLTVEANYNRTAYTNQFNDAIDLVSKKNASLGMNYYLGSELAEITTTSGFFGTYAPCLSALNKTYHMAMVYDGATLKLYRNGFLINQISATGNLNLNVSNTTIGLNEFAAPTLSNFRGYINEVRIWNVARSQSEIQAYMNTPLPAPTSLPGLMAYYSFDNLINKQGNPSFNGVINGAAQVNQINPDCNFTPDPDVPTNAGPDTFYCSNVPVMHQLRGLGRGTFTWTPAQYLDNPNSQNPIATISSTTTFYLAASGSNTCSANDTVTIYVNPLTVLQALPDTTVCQFAPLVLTTNSNAVTFTWSPTNFVNNPNIANPIFTGSMSQRMYVTASSGPGCDARDSVDVTVIPAPVVKTNEDTTLCIGQPLVLSTSGANSYSWNPATGLSNPLIGNPVFTGNSSQTYTVTGTAGTGCTATDQVALTVSSAADLKQPPSFATCQGNSVQLDGFNGSRMQYLWSPSTYLNNNGVINPIASPPQTTLYTVTVSDTACAFNRSFSTLVTIIPRPVVNAGKSNDIDCAMRSATLQASGGTQYSWSPATGLNNPNIRNPLANPVSTQVYTVQVTDANGCSNTDSVMVINNRAISLARYMPNAFTPNGDGKNDCYGLKNWMYIKRLQFFVFNRFGEQVFATANPGKCWDGNYKGRPAMAGSYVYVIKAETDCGTEEQSGSFILIR